ncbi:glycoside hydrolase family 95-like protein, partial [Candidatus Omnitrophota bacterium]
TSFNGFDTIPVFTDREAGTERWSIQGNKQGDDVLQNGGIDPSVEPAHLIKAASEKTWDELYAAHVNDHRELFRRVKLDLGEAETVSLPTDERIASFQEHEDKGLISLLFHYGRYLLIASSRHGSQPANLQGIWNDYTNPPWWSNYTMNMNLEMNYWLAESCNLTECLDPLFSFIEDLSVNGAKTAEVNYGITRGWVAHHQADIWRQTGPVGNNSGSPAYACWPMGGPWLCRHLWERWLFSGDSEFLRDRAWPLMKGAAEFCLEFLTEDENGFLVTNPSTSPEHRFVLSDGSTASVSMASTMDMMLLRDLFSSCIEAADILGIDSEFRDELKSARDRLYPVPLGDDGELLEWFRDFQSSDPHHRHLAHLFALHPGDRITKHGTPKLFEAARKALEQRGDGGTGWSLAWKVNFWARMGDSDRAYSLAKKLLNLVDSKVTNIAEGGGLYPNMFDAHPPFQIDGNFGITAGIAEMLLQSHAHEIELLPALPKIWPQGSVSGLRARTGYEVDIKWVNGRLSEAVIRTDFAQTCRIRYGDKVAEFDVQPGKARHPAYFPGCSSAPFQLPC